MITNRREFDRESEIERWESLRRMSAEDTIALGEAMLTSDIMRVAEFPDDDHPCSLAIALGIGRKPARN